MKQYNQFIENNNSTLNGLSDKRVYLVTPLINGGLLNNKALTSVNASLFIEDDLELLNLITNSDFLKNYQTPIVVDVVKAVGLFKQQVGSTEQRVENSVNLSRFAFMGTDGMRGKISTEPTLDPIKAFLTDNLLTPQMIELTSYAFAQMLLNSDKVKSGDIACVGNDGRDLTTDWALNRAMIAGFNSANLNVVDITVSPTPFVPYNMLKEGYSAGAVLTASHNPANQNGIKYFFDGKKILPEGVIGDYSFAAWAYDGYLNGYKHANNVTNSELDLNDEAISFMKNVIPSELKENLKGSYIVLDTANGAFHELSLKMMDEYNLDYTCVNETPCGSNINRACGVAEVEGQEEFKKSDYDGALTVIKTVFDKGRTLDKTVYGIVLDGDGDRGFVLTYDKKSDQVLVIDGDKSGYIMAMYYKKQGVDTSKFSFVTTVESDIMTAFSAKETLGLDTPIVSVGDKWIGTFNEGELLLGLESSGHLIFPIKYKSNSGSEVELRAGNGLLTALMTLTGITSLGLDTEKSFEPYEPGFSKTFYTYFVDKTLFYRGSTVWNQDREILVNEFDKLKESGKVSKETTMVFEDKEDSHMLYASFKEGSKQLGAIFCRNSGTEDKTAVYVKCKHELESVLLPVGEILKDNHINNMKNPNRKEYRQELIIVDALKSSKNITLEKLSSLIEKEMSEPVTESDMYSVIYGLKKEGRVTFENSLVNAV